MTTTPAGRAPIRWDPRTDRKAYIVWMGLVLMGFLAGFGLDFARYLGETPAPPPILHVHGALYVTWLALVVIQIVLVEKNDIRSHRWLGWATAIVSVTLVPMGIVAALVDEARRLNHPDSDPQFLGLEFQDLIMFSIFIGAGLVWRRDPPAHKRLMILSAIALSDAGFARIWLNSGRPAFPGQVGWWFEYYWGCVLMLAAMIGWDLWRRRRVHPAVLAGAALMIGGEIVTTILQFSPGWKALMTAAVKAWGYTG